MYYVHAAIMLAAITALKPDYNCSLLSQICLHFVYTRDLYITVTIARIINSKRSHLYVHMLVNKASLYLSFRWFFVGSRGAIDEKYTVCINDIY